MKLFSINKELSALQGKKVTPRCNDSKTLFICVHLFRIVKFVFKKQNSISADNAMEKHSKLLIKVQYQIQYNSSNYKAKIKNS